MSAIRRSERERELVALLLFDKPGLLAEYRRTLDLRPGDPVSGVLDRDMIRAILAHEFPAPRMLAASTGKQAVGGHRRFAT